MDLNKFAKRAFSNALKRKKITDTSNLGVQGAEALKGLMSEVEEFHKANPCEPSEHLPQYSEEVEELAGIAITAFTELYRRGVDIEKVLHEKMKFNEQRT